MEDSGAGGREQWKGEGAPDRPADEGLNHAQGRGVARRRREEGRVVPSRRRQPSFVHHPVCAL